MVGLSRPQTDKVRGEDGRADRGTYANLAHF